MAAIDQFTALDAAFSARANRGEKLYARFAALACVASDAPVATLVDRAFLYREDLNEGLGMWRSPGKAMRLVYGGALAARGRTPDQFFRARQSLSDRRRERGARGLSQGGSCAALALVTAGGSAAQADAFFDLREAIAAPWWNRDCAREDVLAAAFAAMGETPDEARARLDRARETLRSAGVPNNHAEPAAREICLGDYDADAVPGAWTALNTAVRGRRAIRHGIGKTGLAVLAADGNGQAMADQLVRAFDTLKDLRPRVSSDVAARLAMRLAQAETGRDKPTSAAGDLAAILAAQAAMIAVIIASTSATVAATS